MPAAVTRGEHMGNSWLSARARTLLAGAGLVVGSAVGCTTPNKTTDLSKGGPPPKTFAPASGTGSGLGTPANSTGLGSGTGTATGTGTGTGSLGASGSGLSSTGTGSPGSAGASSRGTLTP